MAKEIKSVEERIVAAYMGEDGMWIVERGKMKECSLLKEAVARINELKEKLVNTNKAWHDLNREKMSEWYEHREKMSAQEEALKLKTRDFEHKERRFNEKFEGLRTYMNILHNDIKPNEN